jgi:phage terminase large subunit
MIVCPLYLMQKGVSDVRVIDYIEDDHRTLDSYSAQLKDLRYNWGQDVFTS